VARNPAVLVSLISDWDGKDLDKAIREIEKLKGQTDTAAAKFEKMGAKFQTVGASISKVGGSLTKSLTLPIVGLGAVAVKSFADFDAALNQSTAIMGNVSEEVRDRMSKAARDVATSLNMSHAEAAESFYFLASAGLDAEQSIAALPQVAAFAKAGMFDMATATDLATDAQSALGMVSDDAAVNFENLSRVTDVFVKANTLANASVEQFSTAMTTKAGVALRNVGKDIEEGTAVLAVFADQGIKGEQAGTMLTRTLEGLADNARKNSKQFKQFGIDVFDSEGAMRPMVDIVSDLEGAMAGMSVEEQNATIAKLGFNKLAKQGILALLGNSDALAEYESGLRDAGGTVDDVAGKQLETFSEKLGLLKQQFVDIAIEFGPLIIDQFLVPLGEMLRGLAQRLTELTPQQREMIVRFAGIAAVAGPVLLIVGKLVAMFGTTIIVVGKVIFVITKIVAGIKIAISVIGAIIGVLKILGMVMFAALGPIGLIIAGVVALIAVFVALYKNNETVRRIVQQVWQAIKTFFSGVFDAIVRNLKSAWESIKSATTTAMDFVKRVIEIAWNGIKTLFGLTPIGLVIRHWDTLKSATTAAFKFVRQAIQTWINFVQQTPGKVLEALQKIIQFYRELPGRILDVLKGATSWLFNIGKDIIQGLLDGAGSLLRNIGSFFLDMLPGWIVGPFKRALGIASPSKVFYGFGKDIINGFINAVSDGSGAVSEQMQSTINDALEVVRDRLKEYRKGLKEDLDAAREDFQEFARDVSQAIVGSIDLGGAYEGAADRVQAIADAERELAEARAEAGQAGAGDEAAARVLAAESALEQARASGDKLGLTFMEALNAQADRAKEYGAKVQQLLTMDLDPNSPLMQLVMGSSHETGIGIMDELINGGVDTITAAEELLGSVQKEADDIGTLAAGHFRGAGVASAQATINGFDQQFGPGGKGRRQLMRIMDNLAQKAKRGVEIEVVVTRRTNEIVERIVSEIRRPALGVEAAGATGAIVRRPTIALIGEAGPEALLPLDRTRGNAPISDLAGGGITINVTAGMGTDGAEVGRQIVDAIKAYERRNGAVYATA
jgi:TP901 family phage tail tape measure protein